MVTVRTAHSCASYNSTGDHPAAGWSPTPPPPPPPPKSRSPLQRCRAGEPVTAAGVANSSADCLMGAMRLAGTVGPACPRARRTTAGSTSKPRPVCRITTPPPSIEQHLSSTCCQPPDVQHDTFDLSRD